MIKSNILTLQAKRNNPHSVIPSERSVAWEFPSLDFIYVRGKLGIDLERNHGRNDGETCVTGQHSCWLYRGR